MQEFIKKMFAHVISSGLGRTGKLWAHEAYGVKPDIMTLAKPLAGRCLALIIYVEQFPRWITHWRVRSYRKGLAGNWCRRAWKYFCR